jgi:hypothetical protein
MNPQDSGVNQNSNLPPTQPFQPNQPGQSSQPPVNKRVSEELEVMQPGEEKVFELKRHPIGIILIYASIALTLILTAVILFILSPSVISSSGEEGFRRLSIGVFSTLLAFGMIYALVATTIYWGNKWVLTTDSLTQIKRTGLFNRESAQLALVNIEDVTSEQHGILAHLFGYGTLTAQTAAEQGKFVFIYASPPNYYAQQILKTKESLGQEHGHH